MAYPIPLSLDLKHQSSSISVMKRMASYTSSFSIMFVVVLLIMGSSTYAQLSNNFYSESCPEVFAAVESTVQSAVSIERRMGASLVRLHFHDCFVNGCDGSILLDDTSYFTGEKTAKPNNNSLRGFDVVDAIKAKVEETCPGVVSCADILAIAARDSIGILGGPKWNVKVGRRDSKTAKFSDANSGVIPFVSVTLSELIDRFKAQGLSAKDMVALSGAHTIGYARCLIFRDRIYNETNIDSSFAKKRQRSCPRTRGSRDDDLAPLDVGTADRFDLKYYKNLLKKKGLLPTDQLLYNDESTRSLVKKYSKEVRRFYSDFVEAMIKMGDIRPLTGSDGEIRKNCRRTN